MDAELQKILLACERGRLTEQTSESLRAMRAARKQHLHAAFYLKSACARFVEETARIPSGSRLRQRAAAS